MALPQEERKQNLKAFGIKCLATGLFTGYSPFASGTVGTCVGVGIVWLFRGVSVFWFVLMTLGLGIAGAWASERVGQIFKTSDDSRIVIDEVVGYMVAMVGIPVTGYWMTLGFFIFRFFDVVKLEPAKYFDTKIKTGWGVVADDVVAGLYTNLLLHLILRTQI